MFLVILLLINGFEVTKIEAAGNVLINALRNPPRVESKIFDIAKRDGYKLEEHYITTVDSYILKVHRIPVSPNQVYITGRPVVFLQHGLLGCSDTWLINGRDNALAYILSDAGYDVWMGNARGNTHSRYHEKLRPTSKKFWNFTWHEIGIYDLSIMLDYALQSTNQSKLHYAGHSQGTTSFFVLTSLHPEYNNKIKTMHALSPVVFMSNLMSPIFRLPSYFLKSIQIFINIFGFTELLPNSWVFSLLQQGLCRDLQPIQNFCSNMLFLTGGFNPAQINVSLIPEIFSIAPAGASVFQLLHYVQGVSSGKFRQFDHGTQENLVRYGRKTPPDYALKNVTAPVYIYYSENDWIAAIKDVNTLISKLPNVIGKIRIADEKWTHFDYIFGINAKDMVYDHMLKILNSYEKFNANGMG